MDTNTNLMRRPAFIFLQFLRATMAGAGSWSRAEDFVTRHYGRSLASELIRKAALGPVTMAELDSELAASYRDFVALVDEHSVVGRLALRRVPFDVRYLALTAGAQGYWVGEGKPLPFSLPTLAGATLAPLKVQAAILQTKEVVLGAGPTAQAGFNAELLRAIVAVLDDAFLDPGNAGIAHASPAAVTHSAVALPSTGDDAAAVVADIGRLLEAFGGDLGTAVFVSDPTTAVRLALLGVQGTLDVTPRGGSLFGVPFLTTRASRRTTGGGALTVLDPAGITYAADPVTFDQSDAATVQASDTPDDPVTGGTVELSLWHHNLVALRLTQFANWRAERPGAVATLDGLFAG